MSLFPPNPIVHSKCYFFLQKTLCTNDDGKSFFEEVVKRLPPFPLFKLKVIFRNLESIETHEYTDDEIISFITGIEEYSKQNSWNCADIVMNMYTRVKKPIQEKLNDEKKKGVISFYVMASYTNGENWNDMYCDDVLITQK